MSEERDDIVIPVVEEEVVAGARPVKTGAVRVDKHVDQRIRRIQMPLLHEEVEVRRVPVNRVVSEAPAGAKKAKCYRSRGGRRTRDHQTSGAERRDTPDHSPHQGSLRKRCQARSRTGRSAPARRAGKDSGCQAGAHRPLTVASRIGAATVRSDCLVPLDRLVLRSCGVGRLQRPQADMDGRHGAGFIEPRTISFDSSFSRSICRRSGPRTPLTALRWS